MKVEVGQEDGDNSADQATKGNKILAAHAGDLCSQAGKALMHLSGQ